jgi:hypothetical protein
MYVVVMISLHADCLRQRSHDCALRELDLERILGTSSGTLHARLGDTPEVLHGGSLANQHGFGARIAPWLVCDTSERDASGGDRLAIHFESGRHRNECKSV